MKQYNIITIGDMPKLIHQTDSVARQIVDTATFIREHMNNTSMLTIMDPETNQIIAIGCFAVDMERDFERLLCEFCANEETYIHSVIHDTTKNHLIVAAPANKHFYTFNAIYTFDGLSLDLITTL